MNKVRLRAERVEARPTTGLERKYIPIPYHPVIARHRRQGSVY